MAASLCGNIPGISDTASRSMHNPETNRAESLYSLGVAAKPSPMCRIQAERSLGGPSPVFADRAPGIAQTFFVRIAVLRNDRGDSFRVSHRQAETCRRAIIEYV